MVMTAEDHGSVRLRIVDDGIGLDPDTRQASRGMGSRLVGSFAQQLDVTYRYNGGEGTEFELSFPRRAPPLTARTSPLESAGSDSVDGRKSLSRRPYQNAQLLLKEG
jgi:hypothetical protein